MVSLLGADSGTYTTPTPLYHTMWAQKRYPGTIFCIEAC